MENGWVTKDAGKTVRQAGRRASRSNCGWGLETGDSGHIDYFQNDTVSPV